MPQAANPAPVSGPGALSRRTDGGPAQKLRDLPDAKYGEQATYQEDQRGAPLSQTPGPSAPGTAPQYQPNPNAASALPFSAPTQHPGEPVTSGAALGHGPGPEALGVSPQQAGEQDVNKLAAYMPVLEFVANLPNASPGARLAVNLMKAAQGGGNTQQPGESAGQPPVQGAGGPGPL